MSGFKVRINDLSSVVSTYDGLKSEFINTLSTVGTIRSTLPLEVLYKERILTRLKNVEEQLKEERLAMSRFVTVGRQAANLYRDTESELLGITQKQVLKINWVTDITSTQNEEVTEEVEQNKKILNIMEAIADFLSKKGFQDPDKQSDAALASILLGLFSTFYTFGSEQPTSWTDVITSGSVLIKGETAAYKGLYSYLEKYLIKNQSAEIAAKFSDQWYGKVGAVAITGSVVGFIGQTYKSIMTLFDSSISQYGKADQVLKNVNSLVGLSKTIVQVTYGKKVLETPFKNQIISHVNTFNTPAKASTVLQKTGAWFAVLGVGIDVVRGGITRYEKVTADGTFDMGDIAEVTVAASIKGLTSVIKGLLGLDFTDSSDKVTDSVLGWAESDLTNFAETHYISRSYIENTSDWYNDANNEKNNVFYRVGVSAVAGTGMIIAMAADATIETMINRWNTNKQIYGNTVNMIQRWFD